MSASLFDLSGKKALVTGGNTGIGFAMASALAEAGAEVIIAGRNRIRNERVVEELHRQGYQAAAIEADVASESDCIELVRQAVENLGGLDIVLNNAGSNIRKQPESFSAAEWRTLIDTNLTSAFIVSKEAFPFLKERGGKIINIGSMASIFGAPFAAPYSASKGGIVQLTKALASAWAKFGIQVNAILPGWVDTALTEQLRIDVPDINATVLSRTPAGRWGRPADFAGIAVFLAAPASDFVTGAAIPVDGGYSSQA